MVVEATLTSKELEAFKLSVDGAGYRRISAALGIAPETARKRVRNARAKLIDHPEVEAYLARNSHAA